MKKIVTYVKAKTDKYLAIHDEFLDEFNYCEFGKFLSSSAERHYKNEKMLAFFQKLNQSISGVTSVTKKVLVDYLENTKNEYVKVRLKHNPVNFSTNPMTNLIQLWDFELYEEFIKEIDILLHLAVNMPKK